MGLGVMSVLLWSQFYASHGRDSPTLGHDLELKRALAISPGLLVFAAAFSSAAASFFQTNSLSLVFFACGVAAGGVRWLPPRVCVVWLLVECDGYRLASPMCGMHRALLNAIMWGGLNSTTSSHNGIDWVRTLSNLQSLLAAPLSLK